MKEKNWKRAAGALLPLIVAAISFFVVAKYTSSTEFNAKIIASLDEKKTTVMELTAASTAASAAITLIPGDAGTPIAEKLADLSGYFLIVLCAIYLEKYLVTVMGYAAFKILIPLACLFFSAYILLHRESCRVLTRKFLLFGLAVYLVIPASVKVSDMIEETYASSIENTLENAKQTTEEIQAETAEGTEEKSEEADGKGTVVTGESNGDSQSQNAGNKGTALESKEENLAGKEDEKNAGQEKKEGGFLSGLFSKVQEGVSTVQEGVSLATANVENTLNRFIEALAILLVTSCLIPILVLLFFVWLVKLVLGTNLDIPKRGFK